MLNWRNVAAHIECENTDKGKCGNEWGNNNMEVLDMKTLVNYTFSFDFITKNFLKNDGEMETARREILERWMWEYQYLIIHLQFIS